MTFKLKARLIVSAVTTSLMLTSMGAQAGTTISLGEDKSLSVGFGMRSSYSSVEDASASGGRSNDFSLDSSRLYLSGSFNKYIKGMLNTNVSDSGTWDIIDANVQLQ